MCFASHVVVLLSAAISPACCFITPVIFSFCDATCVKIKKYIVACATKKYYNELSISYIIMMPIYINYFVPDFIYFIHAVIMHTYNISW